MFDANGDIIGIMMHIYARSDISYRVAFVNPIIHAREVTERLLGKSTCTLFGYGYFPAVTN